ncbi:MAG: hypothetical protein LUQ42_00880, partial [Methanomicrobiales archaeon]|nr:hypothetical protein [Methanomicrobiales archaeon]
LLCEGCIAGGTVADCHEKLPWNVLYSLSAGHLISLVRGDAYESVPGYRFHLSERGHAPSRSLPREDGDSSGIGVTDAVLPEKLLLLSRYLPKRKARDAL